MNPKTYFKKPVQALATKLMLEQNISREAAVKLIWRDLILIWEFVDHHYSDLSKEQRNLEVGGRFDAYLKGEYNPYNG